MNATITSRIADGGRLLAIVVLGLTAVGLFASSVALAQPPTEVGHAVKADVSPPLRSIPPARTLARNSGPLLDEPDESDELPDAFRAEPFGAEALAEYPAAPDPVRQASAAPALLSPSTLVNWPGLSNSDNTFFVSPKTPDAQGDVGLNDYVQWVNLKIAVWSKDGGTTPRYGPVSGNTLWSGIGGPCQEYNWGDPQVAFDRIANRWVFMQYAFPTNFTEPIPPYYLCIAVSKTSDPTGAFNRYAFRVNVSSDSFPDYPKLGVWPDGYYVTTNNFAADHTPQGAAVFAFDRAKMLAGDPTASFIEYQQPPMYKYLLPASFTGSTLPPAGASEYFGALEPVHCGVSCKTMFGGTIRLWHFHADFAVPSNSSFTGPTNLPVSPYQSLCMMSGCIPQPGTTQKVDAGSDHLMQRLQYRNFGDHESLVVTHTVDAGGGVAGMRWYEIQASPPGSEPSVKAESTYAPGDGINRWMGSVGMDGSGNIALGYSMSTSSLYPSVGFTGSAAGSETMGLGETRLITGGGSETGTDRWGDYSAMSIDPSDDETFWYTQEYYAASSGLGWTTRIGAFRLTQGPSATLTQVNGGAVAFPYATKQNVSSVAGGCSPGKGSIEWSVSGPQNESGTVSCSGSGTWTASLTSALTTDGSYTLSATQSTASSPNQTLTLDTTPPGPPTLTALPEYIRNGQSLTATSVSDNGGGSGVKQVNYLYCAGPSCTPSTLIGSSSTAAGNYPVTWSGQPSDAGYRVMAQTEDEAGNTASSAIQSTTIDNTRPAVSLTQVDGAAVAFPYATSQSVTTVGGSCGLAAGDLASVSWSVSGAASASGSTGCSEGGWSATVSLSAQGTYTLSATQKDQVGNTGSTGSRSIAIDETAPAVPTLTALPTYIKNGQSLTATGVGDPGGSGVKRVNYLYCAGQSCTPTTLIGSSSTAAGNYPVAWSGQPADGIYEVMAQTEDKAGNTANSGTQATTIDNTPPVVSLREVNGTHITFPYATNRNVTSIGGLCTAGDGNVSWSIGGLASQSGAVPCPSGTWVVTLTTQLSKYGSYLLSATQSDQAGNIGSSGQQLLLLGDLPPIASFTFLPTAPRVGEAVLFNGGASSDPDGAIRSYAWRFGDGADASGATASHGYAKAGSFTAQLSVTDDSGGVGVAAKSLSISAGSHRGPSVRLQIPPQRLPDVLTRGLYLRVASNERADAKLRLVLSAASAKALGLGDGKRAMNIATKKAHLPAGKMVALRLPIFERASRHLRRAQAATIRLRAVVTGATGKTTIHRRLVLRR